MGRPPEWMLMAPPEIYRPKARTKSAISVAEPELAVLALCNGASILTAIVLTASWPPMNLSCRVCIFGTKPKDPVLLATPMKTLLAKAETIALEVNFV